MDSHTMLVNGILSSLADASVKALVLAALAFLCAEIPSRSRRGPEARELDRGPDGHAGLALWGPACRSSRSIIPPARRPVPVADSGLPRPARRRPRLLAGSADRGCSPWAHRGAFPNTSPSILPVIADRTGAPTWPAVLVSVYLTGASLMLARLALGVYGCRRLVRRCRPLDWHHARITMSAGCLSDGSRTSGSSSETRFLLPRAPGPGMVQAADPSAGMVAGVVAGGTRRGARS